jgi:hypothetical protein
MAQRQAAPRMVALRPMTARRVLMQPVVQRAVV